MAASCRVFSWPSSSLMWATSPAVSIRSCATVAALAVLSAAAALAALDGARAAARRGAAFFLAGLAFFLAAAAWVFVRPMFKPQRQVPAAVGCGA